MPSCGVFPKGFPLHYVIRPLHHMQLMSVYIQKNAYWVDKFGGVHAHCKNTSSETERMCIDAHWSAMKKANLVCISKVNKIKRLDVNDLVFVYFTFYHRLVSLDIIAVSHFSCNSKHQRPSLFYASTRNGYSILRLSRISHQVQHQVFSLSTSL